MIPFIKTAVKKTNRWLWRPRRLKKETRLAAAEAALPRRRKAMEMPGFETQFSDIRDGRKGTCVDVIVILSQFSYTSKKTIMITQKNSFIVNHHKTNFYNHHIKKNI